MIRINLIPTDNKHRQESTLHFLVIAAAVLILALGACFGWVYLQKSHLEATQKTIVEKQATLERLKRLTADVDKLDAKKAELQKQLDVIEKLKKSKIGPVRALDDLANEIPSRVWLTALKEVEGRLDIDGEAVDHENVSSFMKALQKSKYFSDVELKFSNSSSTNRDTLYKFRISCRVDYSA